MAWLHPKGQYSNPESIAVATESPVAKMQVAMVASPRPVRTVATRGTGAEQSFAMLPPARRGTGLRLTPPQMGPPTFKA